MDTSGNQYQGEHFKLHLEELTPEDLEYNVGIGLFEKKEDHREHFAIHPYWLSQPRQGIIQELMQTLGKWNNGLQAYAVGFENVRSDTTMAAMNEDHQWLHVDVLLTYFHYKPEEGQQVRGVVKKIGIKAAICVLFNVFTATVFPQTEEERQSWTQGDEIDFVIYSFQKRRKGPVIRANSVGTSSKKKIFEDNWEMEDDDPMQAELKNEEGDPTEDLSLDLLTVEDTTSPKKKKKKNKDKHKASDDFSALEDPIEIQDLLSPKKSKKLTKHEIQFDYAEPELEDVSQEYVLTSPKKKKKHKKRKSDDT